MKAMMVVLFKTIINLVKLIMIIIITIKSNTTMEITIIMNMITNNNKIQDMTIIITINN